jgi:hypothetical protein
MKKTILFFAALMPIMALAQWNYDTQGILYSNANTVSVGSTPIGSYGASDRAFELISSTTSIFTMRGGSNDLILCNSPAFGNYLRVPANGPFSINIGAANPAIRIQTNGTVGIGTTLSPTGYRLAVGGKIIAEELKVQLQTAPWPDYVFTPDYKLPTLAEVEKHIAENGHLAEIPSAGQVKANGFEVGEMNRLLLQKVEELTLYMIEQNKVNEKQAGEIAALRAELKETTKNRQ